MPFRLTLTIPITRNCCNTATHLNRELQNKSKKCLSQNHWTVKISPHKYRFTQAHTHSQKSEERSIWNICSSHGICFSIIPQFESTQVITARLKQHYWAEDRGTHLNTCCKSNFNFETHPHSLDWVNSSTSDSPKQSAFNCYSKWININLKKHWELLSSAHLCPFSTL